MKLGARDIDAFLKTPAKQAQAVLLYGPDAGLVRERSRMIAAHILGKDSDPLNQIELGNEQLKSDPARLRDELSALSLMGGNRLIILNAAGDKMASVIASAFEELKPTAYLIVEAEELSPSSSLRQLFEKAPSFAALACYHDEGRNLEQTIRTTLAGRGLRVSADALQYLTENLGNDRGVTLSELEKITVFMGEEKEISLETAKALTDHNASETLEDICHAVASGRLEEAQMLLTRLLHEGTQPVAMIRSLMRHFQRLDIVLAHVAKGESLEQAIASLRPPVFFKYVPLLRRELSLWDARRLAQVLGLFLRTEKELKSGQLTPALLAGRTLLQAANLAAA